MKRYWRIDVPGEQGYSFAVISEADDPEEVIAQASMDDLFDLPQDARYASAEDITDDDYELKYWKDSAAEIL